MINGREATIIVRVKNSGAKYITVAMCGTNIRIYQHKTYLSGSWGMPPRKIWKIRCSKIEFYRLYLNKIKN